MSDRAATIRTLEAEGLLWVPFAEYQATTQSLRDSLQQAHEIMSSLETSGERLQDELAACKAERDEARAEVGRLRECLTNIEYSIGGDCPAALAQEEFDSMTLRAIKTRCRKALEERGEE